MTRIGLIMGALVICACFPRDRLSQPDTSAAVPGVPTTAGVAYLSLSRLSPTIGGTVTVSGNVSVGDSLSIGSFRARLLYDTVGLRYLGEDPDGRMTRAVNPASGQITIAGAAADANAGGKLFSLRFAVLDPAALSSLRLRIDELNDAHYVSRLGALTLSSRIFTDGGRTLASASSESATNAASPTRLDSIRPTSGIVDADRVTDIVLYGSGFAPAGNVVSFDGVKIDGLLSENGRVVRFAAPVRNASGRFAPGPVNVTVHVGETTSNALTFVVRGER